MKLVVEWSFGCTTNQRNASLTKLSWEFFKSNNLMKLVVACPSTRETRIWQDFHWSGGHYQEWFNEAGCSVTFLLDSEPGKHVFNKTFIGVVGVSKSCLINEAGGRSSFVLYHEPKRNAYLTRFLSKLWAFVGVVLFILFYFLFFIHFIFLFFFSRSFMRLVVEGPFFCTLNLRSMYLTTLS